MGFLYQTVKIPNAISLTFFLNIFAHARFILVGALTRFGLYKPPPEEETNSRDNNGYILILDGTSPSLVPVPVHLVTAAVKNRVPIVQYQHHLLRRAGNQESEIVEEEEQKGCCSICLEQMELRDEIRELCNCRHVFHRACLDTWIDEGQVTCPLCRSMLLPPNTSLLSITRSCANNNSFVENNHSINEVQQDTVVT